MLNIGFFEDFAGADSVLLTGSPEDIASLSSRLKQFLWSSEQHLPIHTQANVSVRRPVLLFASRTANVTADSFHWLVSLVEPEMLEPLVTSGKPGHQYFELAQSKVQLVVSVGEYSEQWWQAHG